MLARLAVRQAGSVNIARRTVTILRAGGVSLLAAKVRALAHRQSLTSASDAAPPSAPGPYRRTRLPEYVLPASEGINLDYDFGVERDKWQRFLARRSRVQGDGDAPTFIVFVTAAAGSPEIAETRQALTDANLRVQAFETCDRAEFPQAFQNVLTKADDSDLVLFLQAGDRLDVGAADVLKQTAHLAGDLYLFDTYFIEDDRVFPQLHPGLNELFGVNCDYFRSRFLARVGALRRILYGAPYTDAYQVAKALLMLRLQGEDVSAAHLPNAFVGIADSHARMGQESAALIAGRRAEFGISRSTQTARSRSGVSAIICTRDKGHLLRATVRGLMETGRVDEIVVVSHATQNPYALKALEDLRRSNVRVIAYDGPFNFSRQCNLGARNAVAPHLLFMNDDVVPATSDWLDRLLEPFDNPTVGMSGPLLLYPDETVQHAGMFLGYKGVAGHVLRGSRLPAEDYLFMTQAPREVSCVTGAVMVVDRQLFENLNGFDPLLGTYIQDVDLCLRVGHSGFRIVFNPRAILLHLESSSVREMLADPAVQATRAREYIYFVRRWGETRERDAFHNSSFLPNAEDLRAVVLKGATESACQFV
jgi:GT2 family glycosyltransferase